MQRERERERCGGVQAAAGAGRQARVVVCVCVVGHAKSLISKRREKEGPFPSDLGVVGRAWWWGQGKERGDPPGRLGTFSSADPVLSLLCEPGKCLWGAPGPRVCKALMQCGQGNLPQVFLYIYLIWLFQRQHTKSLSTSLLEPHPGGCCWGSTKSRDYSDSALFCRAKELICKTSLCKKPKMPGWKFVGWGPSFLPSFSGEGEGGDGEMEERRIQEDVTDEKEGRLPSLLVPGRW